LFHACAIAALGALAAVVPREALAADITGRVTAVATGDTFTLSSDDKREITVRLSDVAAPVGGGFYAPSARQLLSNMILNEPVRVAVTAEQGPDRIFGHAYRGLLDVNLEMVKAGAAWTCVEFTSDTSYWPYQSQAMRRRLGLWSQTTEFDARIACRERPPVPKR